MIKNFKVKRLLAFVIALLNLLTVIPVVSVAAADTVAIYDAHISGNFVLNGALTAEYSYEGDLDVEATNATIKWYATNLYGTATSNYGRLLPDSTGLVTYEIPENFSYNKADPSSGIIKNAFANVLFYSITPVAADGTPGETVFSQLGTTLAGVSETDAPRAYSPAIVPLNAEGRIGVGDTVAARFSYRNGAAEEGATTYTWYVSDAFNTTRTVVQEEKTAAEGGDCYTITEEDFGKCIHVDITPVSVNGTKGVVSTTYNYFGNAFYNPKTEVITNGYLYGTSQLYSDISKRMADGLSHPTNAVYGSAATNYPSGFLITHNSSTRSPSLVFKTEEPVVFDAFYLLNGQNNNSTTAVPSITISYSDTGEDGTWTTAVTDTSVGRGAKHYILNGVEKAQYFKIDYINAAKSSTIGDFYPFMTDEAMPTFELEGREETYVLVGQEDYIEPGFVALDGAGDDASQYVTIDGVVNDDVIGEYTLTYTFEMPGMPVFTKTRKVIVDTGVKTPGDYAFKTEVTSENATGDANLTDGNYLTFWEATSLPASAVIDLGEKKHVSKFEIDEEGDNIQGFKLYVSDDNEEWTEVYAGTTAGFELVDEFTLSEARYVKLEITEALELPKLKDIEIHVADDDKVALAIEDLHVTLDNIIAEQEHEYGYIYDKIDLPVGEDKYGTVFSWQSLNEESLTSLGYVTRGEEHTPVILCATVAVLDDDDNVLAYDEENFTVTVSKIGTPTALDVHIDGNFVYGYELTADFTYYDESGIPVDRTASSYVWTQSNQWGSETKTIGSEMTYIPTAEDLSGAACFYTAVTPKNRAGDVGSKVFSSVASVPKTVSTPGLPTGTFAYISTESPDCTMEIGDVLVAHYNYSERGGTPEGETTYLWRRKDSMDDNFGTTIQSRKTAAEGGNTYTLTENDYGKWIECNIVPVSATGEVGNAIETKVHYGNAALSNSVIRAGGGFRSLGAINAGKVFAFENTSPIYGSVNNSELTATSYTLDLGEAKDFNAIYFKAGPGSSFTDISIAWSDDNVTYTTVAELETTSVSASAAAEFEIKKMLDAEGNVVDFPGLAQARYFKINLSKTSYSSIDAFYPYISGDAQARIILDAKEVTVVKGQSVNVLEGMSAKDPYGADVTGIVEINGSVDSNVLGEQKVTYILEVDGFPTIRATKTYNVVSGVQTEGDVAFGAKVSATANAADAKNLVDGNSYTSWTGTGTSADIVLDFGEETGISSVVLDEDGNVETVTVLVSDNGSDWKTLATDVVPDASGEVSFTPAETRYVKLSLAYTTAPTVKDIELSVSDAAKVTLAKENLDLSIDLDNVTDDIALPAVGDYGTTIEWSEPSGVITPEGVIDRTNDDQTVTLTATISLKDENGDDVVSPVTKEFEVTVSAKETKKESSSGGGGGSYFKTPTLNQAATAPTPIASYETFVDVPDKHWAAPYVNKLAASGVVSGRAANSFAPDANITRAEYLKLLVTSLGITAENAKADFADVSKDDWYYDCVAIASTLGIATGTDGSFMPNEPILRRDMAVLAERAINVLEASLIAETEVTLKDLDGVAEYARAAVTLLAQAGIINGNENGEFMPDNLATRAQTAKIIYMLQESVKGAE